MNEREIRIKKILYRSWYRGCRETDKIIGNYVRQYINQMSDAEFDELEFILGQDDNDIYDWLSGKKDIPQELKTNSVFQNLLNYKIPITNC